MSHNAQHQERDRKLRITIVTPVGQWTHPFDPDTTVQAVIDQTLNHFTGKLEPGNYRLEQESGEILDPSAEIGNFGFDQGTTLLLVPAEPGQGV